MAASEGAALTHAPLASAKSFLDAHFQDEESLAKAGALLKQLQSQDEDLQQKVWIDPSCRTVLIVAPPSSCNRGSRQRKQPGPGQNERAKWLQLPETNWPACSRRGVRSHHHPLPRFSFRRCSFSAYSCPGELSAALGKHIGKSGQLKPDLTQLLHKIKQLQVRSLCCSTDTSEGETIIWMLVINYLSVLLLHAGSAKLCPVADPRPPPTVANTTDHTTNDHILNCD
jgi:hypothetical protein